MYVLPQLCQFWEMFQTELANKEPYKASIGKMKLRLAEFQKSDKEAQRLRVTTELKKGWEDVNGVLHYQELPFVPEIIQTELINRKYYWPSLKKVVEALSRAATFVYCLKRSDISPMVTCKP